MTSTDEQMKRRREKMRHIRENLPFFAEHCLHIKNEDGQIVPFKLNRTQKYIHQKLEEQKARTGKVRALILKGRQQGASTYTAARFFHRTVFEPGTGTFILSHQAKTTGPLFDMVKRFLKYMPEPLAPIIDTSNKNQIKFAELESEYTVGTAGNEDLGRGLTIRQLHCSEAAWYGNTDDLETGLFQAVSNMDGTEIIHESTANGMNNMFYRKAMDALKGRGEFILIFTPWFWKETYATKPPPDFSPTSEESELMRTYDLTRDQIYWRRNKIADLKDEWKFMQEYPMNPMEAFIVSGSSFLSPKLLMEARKRVIMDPSAPKIVGLDASRVNDRTVWICRQGRKILWKKVIRGEDMPEDPTIPLGQETARLIDRENIDKCFIDYGQGYGIIDFLRASGYKDVVQGVYFSHKPMNPQRFLNKRAEMAFAFRDWIEEGYCDILDDDEYYVDLLITPMYLESPTKKIYLESKRKIKEKFGVSPDEFDATILTFAYPVSSKIRQSKIQRVDYNRPEVTRRSELSTVRRIAGTQRPSNTVSVRVNH